MVGSDASLGHDRPPSSEDRRVAARPGATPADSGLPIGRRGTMLARRLERLRVACPPQSYCASAFSAACCNSRFYTTAPTKGIPMLTTLRRVALALALVLPTSVAASPIQQDYPAAYDNIVKVVLKSGHGSGFVLDAETVVTAEHVIRNQTSVMVVLSNGEEVSASVVAFDRTADVAVLHLRRKVLAGATVRCGAPRVGEHVRLVGYPMNFGRTVAMGEIGGRPVADERIVSAVLVGAPIAKGMSGGPVFGEDGTVVGIAVAFIGPGYATGFSIIVPGAEVCRVGRIGY